MTIRIDETEETTAETLGRMHQLCENVYDDGPVRPPSLEQLRREMRRPKFAGRQRLFVARRPGRDIAMAVVRRSTQLQIEGGPVATVGNFEARHDPEATTALFERAAQWARQAGSEVVVGPMNGDTWHRHRCSLGPWDESPFWMEPYNPSYYPRLWRRAGFESFERYHSTRIDDIEGAARYHRPAWAEARARGYRVEPMNEVRTAEALDRVYRLIDDIYAGNPMYTPVRRSTFERAYRPVASVLEGRLSLFLVDRHGRDAGFAFVCPDYGRRMEARRGPIGRLRSLVGNSTRTANIESFGVAPDHRGRGLAGAMAHRYFEGMARQGFERANLCLIRDDAGRARSMAAGRGRILRRYELYRYTG